MTACEPTHQSLRPILPAQTAPPQDVIATLAHFYCVAGLPPKAAWRSALADYECFFSNIVSVEP